jgi:hypothetical protein
MKTITTFIIALIFVSTLSAQLSERQTNLSLGMQSCISTNVKDIKSKDVEKLWKEYFEKYGKTKYNSKAKEYYSAGVRINRLKSGDPVDVYAKFTELADGSRVDIAFDMSSGFLNSKDYPAEYKGGEEFVKDFAIYVEKYKVEQRLKDEEKALEKLNGKLESAKKDNKNLHEKIINFEEKIKQAEEDIKTNELLQVDLEKQITTQAAKVKSAQQEYNNVGK